MRKTKKKKEPKPMVKTISLNDPAKKSNSKGTIAKLITINLPKTQTNAKNHFPTLTSRNLKSSKREKSIKKMKLLPPTIKQRTRMSS